MQVFSNSPLSDGGLSDWEGLQSVCWEFSHVLTLTITAATALVVFMPGY